MSLRDSPAWLVCPPEPQALARSPALADLAAHDGWWESDLAVMGEPGRTALALGLGAEADSLRLWLQVPLEGEAPEHDLLLLLLLGGTPEALAPAQRLREAFAERESRHAINQPLTAVTFLLENLLFACREGTVAADYLERKRQQLAGQLDRLRSLLRDCKALPPYLTI